MGVTQEDVLRLIATEAHKAGGPESNNELEDPKWRTTDVRRGR